MSGRQSVQRWVWGWFLAAALLAGTLPAQEPGGARIQISRAELRLEAEVRDETRVDPFGKLFIQDEVRLREILGLDFSGDIYHPSFLTVDADLDFQFEQRDNENATGTATDTNTFNILGGLKLGVLPEKSVHGEAYAWKRRIDIQQTLFATSIADVAEYGANLDFDEIFVPSRLHYDRFTYDGSGGDTRQEDWHRLRLDGKTNGPSTDFDYALGYNDVGLLDRGLLYEEFLGNVSLLQRWGRGYQDHFRANAYWREQFGDINTSIGRGTGLLHFQWAESLYSEHVLTGLTSSLSPNAANDQETVEFNSLIRHKLYRSLDTSLLGLINRQVAGERHTDRLEFTGDIDYRKTTSFGEIGLHFRPDVFWQDEYGGSGSVPVVGERHRYEPGNPIYLNNFGVDTDTVAVWNVDRTFLYVELTDYILVRDGARVRVDIPAGSRILPFDIIAIDYVYESQPDKEFRSVRNDASASFMFGNWGSAWFRFVDEDQDLLSGVDNGTLENLRIKEVGIRLSEWDQDLGAEYEDRDSNFTPLERWNFWIRSHWQLANNLHAQAFTTGYHTRFKEDDSVMKGFTIGASGRWRPGRMTEILGRANYHKVDQKVDRGWGWLVEAVATHRFRKTALELTLRYTDENFEVAADEARFYGFFMFRRSF